MPKFDVSMPNPHDVGEAPRKERVEAPDEHSAAIMAAERFGRQPTEISEHKEAKKPSAKKGRNAKAKPSASKSKSSSAKRSSRSSAKSTSNKRSAVKAKAARTDAVTKEPVARSADPNDKPGEQNAHHNADPQSADNSGAKSMPDFKPPAGE